MKNKVHIFMFSLVLFITVSIAQLEVAPKLQANGGASEKLHYYITPNVFYSFGSWSLTGTYLTGRTSAIPGEIPEEGEPASVNVNILSSGQYKLWVRDRDFATNQQGSRFFNVRVDGITLPHTLGTHGQEGFRWTDAGTITLEAGAHELSLHDTSAYFARFEGFLLTKDLAFVPPENIQSLIEIAPPEDPLSFLASPQFPEWATQVITPIETATIENEQVKVIFYKGEGLQGDLVQNEIYIKDGFSWTKVKDRTEQLGFLMMSALDSRLVGMEEQFAQLQQEVAIDEHNSVRSVVTNFYKTGNPIWFIPTDFEKIGTDKVELYFDNDSTDLIVTFEFDELGYEPKVTLDAQFNDEGAYSFMFFNGDETPYEQYETVTAPLLYVKKTVPSTATLIPEAYLFTPMATLHYATGNTRFAGREMTSGIVMDPSSVPQDYAYPDTSSFGLVLRGPNGDVRPQFTAPMFGTENSYFESGDNYSISYRIINRTGSWYDTFKYVAEELFNSKDIRTNYFHSVNEAIYNATDLMMDDDYGGWDSENMAFYNMEEQNLTTHSNSMSALQRYLLTDNEEILDKRAIPTLAYMLGREKFHFKSTGVEISKYAGQLPANVGGPVTNYSAHVYGGLYEMTQGRMPYLLNRAVQSASTQKNLTGVADQAALYKYTGESAHLTNLISQADTYLLNHPGTKREERFISSFIYGDYIPMVATLLTAYEATGEMRYLEGAEKNAQLLMTGLWTTGYHNGYAESNYTVTQADSGTRPLNANRYDFWWHGEEKWRLGNIDGEAKSAQELGVPLEEETAPGWLGSRVGMGTEHPVTPGHGNVITMNNWAGMLSKLSVYTADDFFYNMARNAMIGRFGNYAGYYQDRIIFHQMKENYPYEGPDFTSIYWHHIPVFISMLEDFLINSTWVKSEGNIEFPSLVQSGYAYFASNQFGHAPGRFYEEDNMWLWLDRGIIEPNSVEIDYIAARKEGTLGLALMNEGNEEIEAIIRLGEKVDPLSQYTGFAMLYEADGSMSSVYIANGEFELTIPSKGIRSVIIEGLATVHEPAFANSDYALSNSTSTTLVKHLRGKGHVIQVNPNSYYAYVYAEDKNDTATKMTIHYTIGQNSYVEEKIGYPYEFLIKVDNPNDAFSYQLIATKVGGEIEQLGGGQLKPYDFTEPGIVEEAAEEGRTSKLHTWGTYVSTQQATVQISVPSEALFPLLPATNYVQGMKVTGKLVHPTTGHIRFISSVITANTVDNSTKRVTLSLNPTSTLPLGDYTDWDISLWIEIPERLIISTERINVPITTTGMHSGRNEIRWVFPLSAFPYPVEENKLNGLTISGTLTHKTDNSTIQFESVIRKNEPRAGGTSGVLVVEPTVNLPLADYINYRFNIGVNAPINWRTSSLSAPLEVGIRTTGTVGSNLKLVADTNRFPFSVANNQLKGYRIAGEFINSSGAVIHKLDSYIVSNALRQDGGIDLVVPPTTRVPLAANYVRTTMTIYPQTVGMWNQTAHTEGDYYYEINTNDNSVIITGFTGKGDVNIPHTITGLPVTAIGESAFQNKSLTSVSIPSSVTQIGVSAFRDNALTSVIIPHSVQTIGDGAFRLNTLSEVTVGGTTTVFGTGVFAYNPLNLTLYGYQASTTDSYASQNNHLFSAIEIPVISFLPDGSSSWEKQVATTIAISSLGDEVVGGIWTQSDAVPDINEDWTLLDLLQPIEKEDDTGIWYMHVQTTDRVKNKVYGTSQPFYLDNEAPTLVVVLKTEDNELYISNSWSNQTVTANVYSVDAHSGLSSIKVSVDNGTNWTDITYNPTIEIEDNGITELLFKATDLLGNEHIEQISVLIDKQAPEVFLSPNGSGSTPHIDAVIVTVIDKGAGVKADSLSYIWSNSELIPSPSESWTSFIPGDELDLPNIRGDWYLHINAQDNVGNETKVVSDKFRVVGNPGQGNGNGNGNGNPGQGNGNGNGNPGQGNGNGNGNPGQGNGNGNGNPGKGNGKS